MGQMTDKVVIITGASSGIGRAMALEQASRGATLVLGARRKEALDEVVKEIADAGGKALAVQADVVNKADCERLVNAAVEHFGRIDVLVNNAGISMRAIFEEMDLEVMERVMAVNFWGTVYCTSYAIPHLLKTKGSVVGVSSIAGYVGLPARTAYSASKYAMQGFLDALRTENLKTGLHVMVACPGYTASNIRKTALTADGSQQGETPLKEEKIMTAEAVAEAMSNAITKRKRTLVLTTEGKLAVLFSKIYPSFIEKMVFKKVTSEPGSPIRLS